MALDPDFGVSITPSEFSDRFLALHWRLFATTEFAFNDVTTHVYTPPEGMFQYEDEKTLEEGLYLSRIRWDGDFPVLEKPER